MGDLPGHIVLCPYGKQVISHCGCMAGDWHTLSHREMENLKPGILLPAGVGCGGLYQNASLLTQALNRSFCAGKRLLALACSGITFGDSLPGTGFEAFFNRDLPQTACF